MLNILGMEGDFLNLTEDINGKPVANNTLMVKDWKLSS